MISTERRRRDPIYLQLAYVPLQEAKALLNRTPLDVVFRRVVALERIGHDARSSRAPLREERLEAQLELGLLLEIERVDLSGCSHAVICAYTRVRTSEDETCAGACNTRLDGRDAPSRAHARV